MRKNISFAPVIHCGFRDNMYHMHEEALCMHPACSFPKNCIKTRLIMSQPEAPKNRVV
jgi:hypothetical protein